MKCGWRIEIKSSKFIISSIEPKKKLRLNNDSIKIILPLNQIKPRV